MTCLKTRLVEAGYAPKGPFEVEDDPAVRGIMETAQRPECHGFAPVVRFEEAGAIVHRLLPVPACPDCADRQAGLRRNTTRATLPADWLLDPLLGIGSWFQKVEQGEGEGALCHSVSGQVHTPGNRHGINARGQGLSMERALLGHFGETVERYAAFRPDPGRVIEADRPGTDETTLSGADLFGYSPRQRESANYVDLREGQRIGWIRGNRLTGGESVWVPAAAVYLSREWNLDEPRFCGSVSNGIAAHRTLEAATDHAAFELFERYWMTRSWHCQDFGTRIFERELPDRCGTMLECIREAGISLHLACVTPSGMPPMVLAVLSAPRAPWYMIGAGADATLGSAAEAALTEACSGWMALVLRPEALLRRPRLRQLEESRGHHRFHAGLERSQRVLRAIMAGTRELPDRVNRDLPPEEAKRAVARVLGDGAAVVDMTPVDCALCGFHVVRVLAPHLPIYSFGRIGTPEVFLAEHELPPAPMPHPYR
ncbi:YcaO-like family protein [Roseibium sp. M-1]